MPSWMDKFLNDVNLTNPTLTGESSMASILSPARGSAIEEERRLTTSPRDAAMSAERSSERTSCAGSMMEHTTQPSSPTSSVKRPPAPWHARCMCDSPAPVLEEFFFNLMALISPASPSGCPTQVVDTARSTAAFKLSFDTLNPGEGRFFTENIIDRGSELVSAAEYLIVSEW
jgi:hypothetical protein